MAKSENQQKWYYDACALDNDKHAYGEIYNGGKRNGRIALAGNLSIGEAYGSNYRKKGQETANSFLDLLRQLLAIRSNGATGLEIVHHKGIRDIFKEIQDRFPRLDIEDAIHLATAIKNGCCELRTADSDLYKLPAKEVKELATKFGNNAFVVTQMN